ncbi:rhodanese-related sulfurtransferase [Rhodobacteraceae bacterium]|nr:rhodanese-related sulfurtransferase [Paracoccaceae bacterium]
MYTVAALYKFTRFADPEALRTPLLELAQSEGVKGTVLLAEEGINGTFAGPRAGIDRVLAHIRTLPGCSDLEWKESAASDMPFLRLKIRIKREIVTMRQPNVDPTGSVGTYVQPSDWNALIGRDDVAVIDTRNDYEVGIGTFEGAIDPNTDSFGEFPEWWKANKHRYEGKKIAMFCTGGIRCEKATNYLIGQGSKDVFHLKGGILKYLEDVAEDQSLWQGECFVFDQRVSVGHGLVEGSYDLCHACRRPVSDADKTHANYEPGVSCHHCIDQFTDSDRTRFRERHKQIHLARGRGEVHIGDG